MNILVSEKRGASDRSVPSVRAPFLRFHCCGSSTKTIIFRQKEVTEMSAAPQKGAARAEE